MGRSKCHLWRKLNQTLNNICFLSFQVVEYEGSNHIRNPEMQRVLLTHEVICRWVLDTIQKKVEFTFSSIFFVLLPSELPPLKSLGEKSHLSFRAALSPCPGTKIGSRRFSRFGNRILFRGHSMLFKRRSISGPLFSLSYNTSISIPPSSIHTILSLNINGTSVRPSRSTCYLKGNSWNRVNGLIWMCPIPLFTLYNFLYADEFLSHEFLCSFHSKFDESLRRKPICTILSSWILSNRKDFQHPRGVHRGYSFCSEVY